MTGSCIREEGGVSCWHMQRHIHTRSQSSISQRLTVRPRHISAVKAAMRDHKKGATQQPHQFSLLSWPWHTHIWRVSVLLSVIWREDGVCSHRCAAWSVCICPLFFCLLLVPWNLTGALLFIHFISFVCSLSLCMCVCQLLYRPAAYSDHSRPRYAQTCDGEGIQ